MNAFLITFKPDTESTERGWPLGHIKGLAQSNAKGESPAVAWRIANRRECNVGDRAFLLMQGRRGPCMIGYGHLSGTPQIIDGKWRVEVTFESILDPDLHVLANADELPYSPEANNLWGTRSSGVRIPDRIAADLEQLIVGREARAWKPPGTNPDWTRDELIVALSHYLRWREQMPGKNSAEIRTLSAQLRRLGEALFSPPFSPTFRNENGVYMKLQNFRRLDPNYTQSGRTGLSGGNSAEEEVWREFAVDPARCDAVANAILAAIDVDALQPGDGEDDMMEAPEGRLLTRTHVRRERNRRLVKAKRDQRLQMRGKLDCDVCEFDFGVTYGEQGKDFIECHHTKPISALAPGDKTHINDLVLVCANCHRMIHRSRPWLTIDQLRSRLREPPTLGRRRTED